MEEVLKEVEQFLVEVGKWSVPGYAFPAILIIGLFYLFLGERICKGVVAGLCFLGGAAAGYHFSDNIAVAVASGVGAAVIALIVQYVVVVVLAKGPLARLRAQIHHPLQRAPVPVLLFL